MLASFVSLSLATAFFAHSGSALDIDVKDQDSIKSAAKTLAGGIVAKYNADLKKERIPGLFAEPYYWWESGAVLGSLIDYSSLTGDNQYDDLIAEGMLFQASDDDNFMPANQSKSLGNDDQSYWALAAMAAAETGFSTSKLGKKSWVDFAINVFNNEVQRWDDKSCDGGLRWQIYSFNNGYDYKNTASNGNLFLLSARLAKFTGNSTYSQWAEKTFNWTQTVGLITEDFDVYDGAETSGDCKTLTKLQWTSNLLTFTEGAALMYNMTKDEKKWGTALSGFVNATSVFEKGDSVLSEVACETNGKCNVDQRAFKGLAARSFARTIQAAPSVSGSLTPLLENSATGAAKSCSGEKADLKCALKWTGDGAAVSVSSGLSEAFSVLSVVQALLVKDAKTPATQTEGANGTSTSGNATNGSSNATESGKPGDEGAAGALGASLSLVLTMGALAVALL